MGDDVECGAAQVALLEHADEGGQVEGLPAPDVDHDGVGRQCAQGVLVDHVDRVGRVGEGEEAPVGGREGGSPGRSVEQRVEVGQRAVYAPLDARHVKAMGPKRRGKRPADGPGPENQGAGGTGEERQGLRPGGGLVLPGQGREAPRESPGQSEGVPGHKLGGAGKAREDDAPLCEPRFRQVVGAAGRGLHPPEVGGLGEHLPEVALAQDDLGRARRRPGLGLRRGHRHAQPRVESPQPSHVRRARRIGSVHEEDVHRRHH